MSMNRHRATPYERIMLAAERRVGVRLSADEVWALSLDDTIAMVGERDMAQAACRKRNGHIMSADGTCRICEVDMAEEVVRRQGTKE